MAKSIFITGTGTDVGKTYVSALIIKKLIMNNINCGYYKPVVSGVVDKNNSDPTYVMKISGLNDIFENVVSFSYEMPASPHLCGRLTNKHFYMEKVIEDYDRLSKKYDYLVVEGAGGIYCPLKDDKEIILLEDIIKTLDLSSLLVASTTLGTLNNTYLTMEYMKNKTLKLNGVIFNQVEESIIGNENLRYAKENFNVPIVAKIKREDTDLNVEIGTLLKFFE